MATGDYCNVSEVRSALGIEDSREDLNIARIIAAASRMIDNECGRRFYAVEDEVVHYTALYSDVLFVDDVLSLSELATDPDGSGAFATVWDSSDYVLSPEQAPVFGAPYTMIDAVGVYRFPRIRRGVRLTGTFGYSATTPAVVREAAILLSARLFKRKDAVFGVVGSAEMGVQTAIASFDPDVRRLLSHLRRRA